MNGNLMKCMMGDSGSIVQYQKFIIDEEKEELYGRDFCILEKYGETTENDIREILKNYKPVNST